jgi:hypothetical protein
MTKLNFIKYNLDVIDAPRYINCKGEGRKPVQEILVTNY